ncbi:Bromo adjacent-likey domain-containing 1 protein [Fragariocoptes setiger]|uniref:Bromo adjacent-likey domain-containing 1 protein n=1 Tax=Fragariocoptes setiger TaxID=1670756 RepID=A0ABQ7SD09_9ACAR|nr:Bromo adjacent-likey domain-containing 1 protein [Fragariocoptes setiger]
MTTNNIESSERTQVVTRAKTNACTPTRSASSNGSIKTTTAATPTIRACCDVGNQWSLPRRVSLRHISNHLRCPICRGYLIDAVALNDCMDAFCKSCIVKHFTSDASPGVVHKCPKCKRPIENHSSPLDSIRDDPTMKSIVYKSVPGLYHREMQQRRNFYRNLNKSQKNNSATVKCKSETFGYHTNPKQYYRPDDMINVCLIHEDDHNRTSPVDYNTSEQHPSTSSEASRVSNFVQTLYLNCPSSVTVADMRKLIASKFGLSDARECIAIRHQGENIDDEEFSLSDIIYTSDWMGTSPIPISFTIDVPLASVSNIQLDSFSMSDDIDQTIHNGSSDSSTTKSTIIKKSKESSRSTLRELRDLHVLDDNISRRPSQHQSNNNHGLEIMKVRASHSQDRNSSLSTSSYLSSHSVDSALTGSLSPLVSSTPIACNTRTNSIGSTHSTTNALCSMMTTEDIGTDPLAKVCKNLALQKRHDWSFQGQPEEQRVHLGGDESPQMRTCYPAIEHQEGDIIKVKDCVLLKSGVRKDDLPYVAKISALWEDPHSGDIMMSLFWYYRPEHIEEGRKEHHLPNEIFASKHKDVNSVACIEDKCYVLTLSEYCRFKKRRKMLQAGVRASLMDLTMNRPHDYPRAAMIPTDDVSQELVFLCRSVYDSKQRRIKDD